MIMYMKQGVRNSQNLPVPRHIFYTIVVVMLLVYAVMIDKYSMYGVDDAWTLSLDYYYIHEGYEFDRVFGNGLTILAYFGKTHAIIYGTWAEIFGWNRYSARLLSSIFIFLGAGLWAASAYKLFPKHSARIAAWSVFLLSILLDAFMSNATKARPEALVLLLAATSLYLCLSQRYFLSGILSGIAAEIHPIGIAACIITVSSILAVEGCKHISLQALKRLILPLSFGLAVGILYYLILHYEHLSGLIGLANRTSELEDQYPFSFLNAYFLHSRFNRHLPDLLFAVGGYAFLLFRWKKLSEYRIAARFALFAGLGIVFLSLIFPRANELYATLLYPALIVLYTLIALHYKKIIMLIAGFLVLLLPQYAYVAWTYRDMHFNSYIRKIREHLPAEDVLLVGHSIYWFAVANNPNHEFYAASNISAPLDGRVFYRIYSDHSWEMETAAPGTFETELRNAGRIEEYSKFRYGKITVTIDRCDYREPLPDS